MYDQRQQTDLPLERLLPRIGSLEAVRRHKVVALIPLVIALGLAFVYDHEREPIYTAEARQAIGRIDVSAPGALSGYQNATKAFASSYSRAIVAPAVVDPVARATNLSSGYVRDHLSASPIAESSVIAVRGTGSSADQARALSNNGAKSLERYVAKLNSSNPNADRLLREFRRVSGRQVALEDQLRRLKRAVGSNPSPTDLRRLNRLRERVSTASVTAFAARDNYAISRRSESNVSILQTISLAEEAESDRSSKLQIILFIALVAGLLVGIGLATLRANLQARDALTHG